MVVGSLNLDHTVMVDQLPLEVGATVLGSEYSTAAGGKGLNQAVAAARQGAIVEMVGAVGDDPAGSLLVGVLADERIGVDHLRRVPGPSGTALVSIDRRGGNTIVVAPGANGTLGPDDLGEEVFAGAAVVVCQLEVPLATVGAALAGGRRAGALTILNPSPAGGPLPDGLLPLVDLVVANEQEAAVVAPGSAGTGPLDRAAAAGRSVVARGAGEAIVTLGPRGALIVGRELVTPVAPFRVTSVDPTAAGDAFVGALAAALAAGEPTLVAARRGAAAGALAVTRRGAVPSLPGRASVDRLVSEAGPGAPPGRAGRPAGSGSHSPGAPQQLPGPRNRHRDGAPAGRGDPSRRGSRGPS